MFSLVGFGNILNFDNLTQENIYVLESPVLSNSQFKKFISFFGDKNEIIDCTFSIDENIEIGLERIKKDAEIAARKRAEQKDLALIISMYVGLFIVIAFCVNLALADEMVFKFKSPICF